MKLLHAAGIAACSLLLMPIEAIAAVFDWEAPRISDHDIGSGLLTWLPREKTADLWKAIMLGLPTPDKNNPQEIQATQTAQNSPTK